MSTITSKERCRAVTPKPDFTIDQGWADYTPDEHARWDRLYARSWQLLQKRACKEFLAAAATFDLSKGGIPDMVKLSARTEASTGWRVVAVPGLVPDEVFFEHLANRRFPAGAFIRAEAEMDYLEEPDVFHDIFGHVPLLADPAYADLMEVFGREGLRALQRGQLHHLARLYWYTVEVGLIAAPAGPRIFGAAIMSSVGECRFALDDDAPHRVAFDQERVMRTRHVIDGYQKTYFVIESFEQLRRELDRDFEAVFDRLRVMPDFEPSSLVGSDVLVDRDSHYRHLPAPEVAASGLIGNRG